jgi:hypothetical protein
VATAVHEIIAIQGPAGLLEGWKTSNNTVAVKQGPVALNGMWSQNVWLPLRQSTFYVDGEEGQSHGTTVVGVPADVGNPHVVVWGHPPSNLNPNWRPMNSDFPDGVNVSFVWPKIPCPAFKIYRDNGVDCSQIDFIEKTPDPVNEDCPIGGMPGEKEPVNDGPRFGKGKSFHEQEKQDPVNDLVDPANNLEKIIDHLGCNGKTFWVKTWERGIGLTQGCGSAACAIGAVLSAMEQSSITPHGPHLHSPSSENPLNHSNANDFNGVNSLDPTCGTLESGDSAPHHFANIQISENTMAAKHSDPDAIFPNLTHIAKADLVYTLSMPGGCIQVWPCPGGWVHSAAYQTIAECSWYPQGEGSF